MDENNLILLYVSLSMESWRTGIPALLTEEGHFSQLVSYPGLKVFPLVQVAAGRLFLLTILMRK